MSEKRLSVDAVEWAYRRHIKNDRERVAHIELLREQSALAQQIYNMREKLRMTRQDLAEFSGLAPEIIEDLEESDHDGDWDEAISRINSAFRHWFEEVILPAAQMKPDDYSVKAVSN